MTNIHLGVLFFIAAPRCWHLKDEVDIVVLLSLDLIFKFGPNKPFNLISMNYSYSYLLFRVDCLLSVYVYLEFYIFLCLYQPAFLLHLY